MLNLFFIAAAPDPNRADVQRRYNPPEKIYNVKGICNIDYQSMKGAADRDLLNGAQVFVRTSAELLKKKGPLLLEAGLL